MPVGGFSRPVVIRESSARHCFLSLPRSLAVLVTPVQTPTFSLVDTEKNRLLLSWAGEMHSHGHSISDAGLCEEVYVSREVLRENGMSDGASAVLVQVAVPPQCSSVSVKVGSLDQWEVLALNAQLAQEAFLSQVRVMGLGQRVPLWLEGGACVTLQVIGLEPPVSQLTLHPMSQVEVLPPSEGDYSPTHTAINFVPSAENTPEELYQEEINEDNKVEEDSQDILTLILEFMMGKLRDRRATQNDFPVRKDIRLGTRVVGLPDKLLDSLGSLAHHPSLVIVGQHSFFGTAYSGTVSFLASIRVIKSPKDLAEGLKEDKKPNSEKKQEKTSRDYSDNVVCAVLVWENYLDEKSLQGPHYKEICDTLKDGNCIVPDVLRRFMKLSDFSVIEIQTSDITTKTAPVCVDVLAITNDNNVSLSPPLLHNIKTVLRDLTDQCPVVINANTLLEVETDDGRLDVLARTRDNTPLQLSRKSAMVLDVTPLKQHPDIPHILPTTHNLRTCFHTKHPYVGNQEVLGKLREHIVFSLGNWSSVGPQFALVQGSKGSGKTSLLESLMESLSQHPHHVHSSMASLKVLRGKKAETIEKKLQLVFREAIFRRPAVVFLDDLDSLVPSAPEEQQDSGPLHSHSMQVVTVMKLLLNQLMEFLGEVSHNGGAVSGGVLVVASCLNRSGIHPLVVSPQGCHYFPCTLTIPPLGPDGRVAAFRAMLASHFTSHCGHEAPHMDTQATDAPTQGHADTSRYLAFENRLLAKRTESFTLPDLSHLALRTYLIVCDRWRRGTREEGEPCFQVTPTSDERKWPSQTAAKREEDAVVDGDLEAALEGYTPLALRGLSLSEKSSRAGRLGVGGLAEARTVLEETLTWPAAHPTLFSKVKLRLRSGVLLYGPPGSGKTLLAHSIAAECHLNFITVKGPELLSKYIGASEEAVRDAFERAASAKPCILFFDEFESIAPRRGHDSTGVTDRVVNQLLTQMDGVEGLSGVYVLAATSRPDLIDPALLRPGRLDKCVFCPIPTHSDRVEILHVLSRDMELGEEIAWCEIADLTESFTGADLQGLLSSAQVLVGQEALGDSLYEGIIPTDPRQDTQESGAEGDSDVGEENELMEAERDYCMLAEGELSGADSYNSIKEVVFEGKGEKVVYKERGSSASPQTAREEETVSSEAKENSPTTTTVRKPPSSSPDPRNPDFRVYQRHILAALREVKPSVTSAERQKYEKLYRSFNKSREGNFGQPSPGKRATLA
ncbi:peroxisome biogenesis protein 1-like [Portunus trituberculatus]|uniref:peroxisome biogenesis protein 1-like n=1 Tax=Portunus trituberculatus TaxID=210409 RepID=UPI001E1D1979|nr:peroxisome biogenesis protein 1-like [Portunus trituberculatus]XP_045126633.1 peroxisome biogenesis protein 1-like [Portunus trituberculatus]